MLPALSVRGSGTPLADAVRIERGPDDDLHDARLVILIHGYRNSAEVAHERFTAFTKTLTTAGWPTPLARFGRFWEFHWTGDHPNTAVGVATYAARVPDARSSGERLAAFLSDLSPEQ